jgi:hypothetical protein
MDQTQVAALVFDRQKQELLDTLWVLVVLCAITIIAGVVLYSQTDAYSSFSYSHDFYGLSLTLMVGCVIVCAGRFLIIVSSW